MKRVSPGFAWFILSTIAALVAVPAASNATPVLPDAFWYSQLDADGNTGGQGVTTTSGSSTITGVPGPEWSATGSAVLQPDMLPSVSAAASVSGAVGSGAYAVVTENTYFTVSGQSGQQVPVIITASGAITQTLYSVPNSLLLFLITPSGTQLLASACTPAVAGPCGLIAGVVPTTQSSFSISAPITLTSDLTDELSLEVSVYATSTAGGDNQSGNIDPMISINPTFPNADLFSIITSPNVGNSASVTPLPAALPLFASGLGALGFVCWRRKRKAAGFSSSLNVPHNPIFPAPRQS